MPPDTVGYGKVKKKFPLQFMDLKNGAPTRDAFSGLFNSLVLAVPALLKLFDIQGRTAGGCAACGIGSREGWGAGM